MSRKVDLVDAWNEFENRYHMNKTVDLVNAWGEFEAKHPDASIEDFCRYYLISLREKENQGKLFNGRMPPTETIVLSKLIQRLATIQGSYANTALSILPLKLEEFIALNAVAHLKDARKTEIIYDCLFELSTGLNLLSNLLKQELITEHEDPEDKRSKRLKITAKGEDLLQRSYMQLRRVNGMVFQDLEEEDILLTVQLLKNIEIKYSALWQPHKGKSMDEILEDMKNRQQSPSSE